jgi:hypothetical protein
LHAPPFDLVSYLNPTDEASKPESGRHAQAIAELGEFIRAIQLLARRIDEARSAVFRDSEIYRLQVAVRRFLQRPKNRIGLGLLVKGIKSKPALELLPRSGFGHYYARALLAAVRLAEAGEIWRLRRCEHPNCPKWYFARRHDQHACSDSCRIGLYYRTPEGKKARAEYMRKHRRDLKQMEEGKHKGVKHGDNS